MINPAYSQASDTGRLADLLGEQAMMPGQGEDPQALIQELLQLQPRDMMRRYEEPGEVGPPHSDISPQDFIEQQLAGDVLPMRSHPPTEAAVNMRLQSPGVGARSRGMESINRFGEGTKSLDLLGILNMMTGREPGR